MEVSSFQEGIEVLLQFSYVIYAEDCFIDEEDGNYTCENLLTEPCEVVYKESKLTDGKYQQDKHQPQTYNCSPLYIREVKVLGELQKIIVSQSQ